MCFRSIGVKSTFLLKLFQLLSLTLILQSGYAECCTKQPNVGLWVQAFGALTNQEADLSNYAYYTKASGGIYGLEKVTASGNIVGSANPAAYYTHAWLTRIFIWYLEVWDR